MIALQVLASVLVVGLLVWQAEVDKVGSLIAGADTAGLIAAIGVRFLGLTLHEVRLWAVLRFHQVVGFVQVMSLGFLAGMWNILAPVRAGDFLLVGLFVREMKLRPSLAVTTVGVVAFLEAAVFGVFLLVILLTGAGRWNALLGVEQTARAVNWVTVLTLGGVAIAVVATVIGRRLSAGHETKERSGPVELLKAALIDTGDSLGHWKAGAVHVTLSAVHVVVFVWTVVLTFSAVGIEVEAPWLAAGGVLAVASLAGVVLPPAMGANGAAAAVLVLTAFGADDAHALAFAGVLWLVLNVPPVLLGLPPMWSRVQMVRELRREAISGD